MKPPRAGFTGTIRDSLGRKVRFVRGKRVRGNSSGQGAPAKKGTLLGRALAGLTGMKGGSIKQVMQRIRNEPKAKAKFSQMKKKVRAAVDLVRDKAGAIDDLKIDGFVAKLKKSLGTVGYAKLLHKLGHKDEHALMVSLSNAPAKGAAAGKRHDKKKDAAAKKEAAKKAAEKKKNDLTKKKAAALLKKSQANRQSRRDAFDQINQDVSDHQGKLTPKAAAQYAQDLEDHMGRRRFELMLKKRGVDRKQFERAMWRNPEVALNVGRSAKRISILARTGGLKGPVAEKLVGIFQKKFGAKGMHELYKRLKIGKQGQAARDHLVKMLTGDGTRRKVRTDAQAGDIFDDLLSLPKDDNGRADMLGFDDEDKK